MGSLPVLPEIAIRNIVSRWHPTLALLARADKPLPSESQFLELLARGPMVAMEILNDLSSDHVRYPPGFLHWKLQQRSVRLMVPADTVRAVDAAWVLREQSTISAVGLVSGQARNSAGAALSPDLASSRTFRRQHQGAVACQPSEAEASSNGSEGPSHPGGGKRCGEAFVAEVAALVNSNAVSNVGGSRSICSSALALATSSAHQTDQRGDGTPGGDIAGQGLEAVSRGASAAVAAHVSHQSRAVSPTATYGSDKADAAMLQSDNALGRCKQAVHDGSPHEPACPDTLLDSVDDMRSSM